MLLVGKMPLKQLDLFTCTICFTQRKLQLEAEIYRNPNLVSLKHLSSSEVAGSASAASATQGSSSTETSGWQSACCCHFSTSQTRHYNTLGHLWFWSNSACTQRSGQPRGLHFPPWDTVSLAVAYPSVWIRELPCLLQMGSSQGLTWCLCLFLSPRLWSFKSLLLFLLQTWRRVWEHTDPFTLTHHKATSLSKLFHLLGSV